MCGWWAGSGAAGGDSLPLVSGEDSSALGCAQQQEQLAHAREGRLPVALRSALQRLSTALYVSDFATQFGKQLGVRALHYDAFERVLAGEGGMVAPTEGGCAVRGWPWLQMPQPAGSPCTTPLSPLPALQMRPPTMASTLPPGTTSRPRCTPCMSAC